MPRLIGTRHDDYLIAHDGRDWIVRGRAGDDEIHDWTGNDRLYGDRGNDTIEATNGGFDQAFGGKGDDTILVLNGEARGGVGNDSVAAYGGFAVGGPGDDVVVGTGQIFGDEGPGIAQQVIGNDQLYVPMGDSFSEMNGGLGNDLFQVTCGSFDGARGVAVITDFTPGSDVIWTGVARPGDVSGDGSSAREFALLDANDNGVLEWSDSLSGGAVYTDGVSMFIGLGATNSGPAGSDAEDWLVVHGRDGAAVTQLTMADWVLT